MSEIRRCNECGEEWNEGGDPDCPFCGSTDTYLLDDDEEGAPA